MSTSKKTSPTRYTTQENDAKVCPECGHVFQGNGWDGIDAHWKAKHGKVMPYEEAWPLLKAGTYEVQIGREHLRGPKTTKAVETVKAIAPLAETPSQKVEAAHAMDQVDKITADTARYEALAREHGADLSEEGFNETLRKVGKARP